MKPELRTLPVIGTHYVEHSIWIDGACAYRQLSPFSEQEIAERVARFRNPSAAAVFTVQNFRGKKPAGKEAKYVWRTGVEEQ